MKKIALSTSMAVLSIGLWASGVDNYRDVIIKMDANKMCTVRFDCIDGEEYWFRGDIVKNTFEIEDGMLTGDTAYKKGLIYFKAGKKEEADRYFAIAKQKGSASGAFAKGMIHLEKGEPQKAIDCFLVGASQNHHKSLLKLSELIPEHEFKFLSKSALSGNSEAMERVAVILMQGSDRSVPQNDALALAIFNFLGAGGNPPKNEDVFINSVLQQRSTDRAKYKNDLLGRMSRSEIKEAGTTKWMELLEAISN
jgi:hypothetical protein